MAERALQLSRDLGTVIENATNAMSKTFFVKSGKTSAYSMRREGIERGGVAGDGQIVMHMGTDDRRFRLARIRGALGA